jgi:hypothetical protein
VLLFPYQTLSFLVKTCALRKIRQERFALGWRDHDRLEEAAAKLDVQAI